MVLTCFCCVEGNEKYNVRRQRKMQKSKASLPEMRRKEKDMEVRTNARGAYFSMWIRVG